MSVVVGCVRRRGMMRPLVKLFCGTQWAGDDDLVVREVV